MPMCSLTVPTAKSRTGSLCPEPGVNVMVKCLWYDLKSVERCYINKNLFSDSSACTVECTQSKRMGFYLSQGMVRQNHLDEVSFVNYAIFFWTIFNALELINFVSFYIISTNWLWSALCGYIFSNCACTVGPMVYDTFNERYLLTIWFRNGLDLKMTLTLRWPWPRWSY